MRQPHEYCEVKTISERSKEEEESNSAVSSTLNTPGPEY